MIPPYPSTLSCPPKHLFHTKGKVALRAQSFQVQNNHPTSVITLQWQAGLSKTSLAVIQDASYNCTQKISFFHDREAPNKLTFSRPNQKCKTGGTCVTQSNQGNKMQNDEQKIAATGFQRKYCTNASVRIRTSRDMWVNCR